MKRSAIDLGILLEEHRRRNRTVIVEECLRIDAADLRRFAVFRDCVRGRLSWTQGDTEFATAEFGFTCESAGTVVLEIELRRCEQRKRTTIPLETTTPHFGGVRFWFRCPRCGRRVRTLFATQKELSPACRRCHDLQYRSAHTHDVRIDRLRKDTSLINEMICDTSGTLCARLRRARLVLKAINAIEQIEAKRNRSWRRRARN